MRSASVFNDGHLDFALAELGKLKESTIHVVNHFSHNGLAGYDQLMPIALGKGFQTAFDGMELEF